MGLALEPSGSTSSTTSTSTSTTTTTSTTSTSTSTSTPPVCISGLYSGYYTIPTTRQTVLFAGLPMATALNLITLNPPGGTYCAAAGTIATTTTITTVATTLQDGLEATDGSAPPKAVASAATLTDAISMLDRQVAPVSASLSDAVGLIDKYAAPITASLSDAFRVIDSYFGYSIPLRCHQSD